MTLREKLLENFRCQNCGNCCQRKGGIVYITRAEAAAIAQFLQKPLFVFLQELQKAKMAGAQRREVLP